MLSSRESDTNSTSKTPSTHLDSTLGSIHQSAARPAAPRTASSEAQTKRKSKYSFHCAIRCNIYFFDENHPFRYSRYSSILLSLSWKMLAGWNSFMNILLTARTKQNSLRGKRKGLHWERTKNSGTIAKRSVYVHLSSQCRAPYLTKTKQVTADDCAFTTYTRSLRTHVNTHFTTENIHTISLPKTIS